MEINDALRKIREFYPKRRERFLIKKLLELWIQNDSIQTYSSNLPKKKVFPIPVDLGVITSDWPGLSDAITGTFHEKGWNIYYERGFIVEYEDKKLGILIVVIKIEDEIELNKFLNEKQEIIENIRYISVGSDRPLSPY